MSKNDREVSAYPHTPTVSRYWLIRQKLCKIGAFLEVSSFVLSVLTIFYPNLWSLFVFCLANWVLTILPSYYIKYLEIRRERVKHEQPNHNHSN